MTNNERVKEFHKACGDWTDDDPLRFPSEEVFKLRIDLLEEELAELKIAYEAGDMVGMADALGDILYVAYGAGHTFGMNLDPIFEEIHRSNMTKTVDGKILRREDGKILKPKTYEPPNIHGLLLNDK